MSKIAAILRVLTFINIEIIGMVIFMLASIIFGIIYTINTIDYIEYIDKKIISNSESTIILSNNINKLNLIDHTIIKKSTQGEDIQNNLVDYLAYRDSFLLNDREIVKFDSLTNKKIEISNRIYHLNSQPIHLEKREFELVDLSLIKKESLKKLEFSDKFLKITISKYKHQISDEVRFLLIQYNKLSYLASHLLNFKIEQNNSNNIRSQKILVNNLKSRFINYIITIIVILILFLIVLIFLVRDIKVKSKIENRNKYLISQLLNRK
jgi:hypothetical protein